MHPILFTIGPLTVYTYGLMLVLGFLAACGLAVYTTRRLPPQMTAISPTQVVDLMCAALFGGLVGGRLLYVWLHWRSFRSTPLELLAIWHGGLVWYGGFVGGVAVVWWYARAKRRSFLQIADQLVAPLALGHAIGRIGCFLKGCCYGRPTDAWYGVAFPGTLAPVVPTQLVESAGLLLLCAALVHRQRAVAGNPGRLSAYYVIGYGLLRFLVEFLRGDQASALGILTLQQLLSIVAFCYGWGQLALCARR